MALLAKYLGGQGRYQEAEVMLRDAVAMIERSVGPQHPRVSALLVSLALVRSAAGRRSDAEADLRRALAIVDQAGGRQESVAVTAALLAGLVARRGDTVESAALFDRAASILRPQPPRFSAEDLAAYAALADHYKSKRQPGDEQFFRTLARGGSPWGAVSAPR
jgi:serine/threonine-protein kinase